ncbi:MAG: hypothetical protein H7Y02_00650 [Candidatus Obscuribacterales bacterium]|nr:hypothetical protein [Steroidobacteraceae bacterium]
MFTNPPPESPATISSRRQRRHARRAKDHWQSDSTTNFGHPETLHARSIEFRCRA